MSPRHLERRKCAEGASVIAAWPWYHDP